MEAAFWNADDDGRVTDHDLFVQNQNALVVLLITPSTTIFPLTDVKYVLFYQLG